MKGQILHISTQETFMVDAIEVDNCYCPVCCKETKQRIGWLDAHCSNCNQYSNEACNQTVQKRRTLLGFSVDEIAKRLRLNKSTIRYYEKMWPSKRYWKATERMVKRHT